MGKNMKQDNEFNYRSLFQNMLSGFAYHKILVDKNNMPIDYVFLEVNDAFESCTGLKRKDIIGKKFTELIPGIKDAKPDLISIYGEVALTGESTKFELYFEPFNKWYLVAAYSPRRGYFVSVFDDISDLKHMEEKLRLMSLTDELTGINNRRGFFALAEQQLKQSIRDKKGIYLVVADVDHLKIINDNLGHHEGDVVIIKTANLLKESFRESDIIGRIGGDEFVILVNETPATTIDTITIRLNEHIKAYNNTRRKNTEISLSIGVIRCGPEEPCNLEKLLAKADELMYEDKRKKQESK